MSETTEQDSIEFAGLLLSLPPEWDASTPERLAAVKDDLVAAADSNPMFEPMLTRFFDFAGDRSDLLIAWLLMPLTTETDEVRGLLFATLVGGVVEDAAPWPEGEPTVELGPWVAIRRLTRHSEPLGDDSLDVLVVQYEVPISESQRFVCECRTPNVFIADELAAHFDEIVSGIRLVPDALVSNVAVDDIK